MTDKTSEQYIQQTPFSPLSSSANWISYVCCAGKAAIEGRLHRRAEKGMMDWSFDAGNVCHGQVKELPPEHLTGVTAMLDQLRHHRQSQF